MLVIFEVLSKRNIKDDFIYINLFLKQKAKLTTFTLLESIHNNQSNSQSPSYLTNVKNRFQIKYNTISLS